MKLDVPIRVDIKKGKNWLEMEEAKMKIAMCASEVVPFAKTGGLADVAGALPLALEELGQEVIIAYAPL